METQPIINNVSSGKFVAMEALKANDIATIVEHRANELKNLFQQFRLPWLDEFLANLTIQAGKKSFLVFKTTSISMSSLKILLSSISSMNRQ
jgi:hypothetical protein